MNAKIVTGLLLTGFLALTLIGGRTSRAAGPWFVSPAGNDGNDCLTPGTACLTIQGAVNKASAGDTINVAAGTYNENVTIAKSLFLRGAQFGVDARGRAASESIITTPVPANPQMTVAFNGLISIDGFTFSGGPTGASGCIFTSVGPNNGMLIINNRFSNYSAAAIWLNRGGTDINIDKNVLDGSLISASGQAIFLNGPQNYNGLFVTNNHVINNTGRSGLFVDGNHNVSESAARAPSISGNLFDKNNVGMNLGSRSFGTFAAPVLGAYGGSIQNNVFSNNAFDGVQGGIQHVLVSGNQFLSNGRTGLALTSFGNTGADRGGQFSNITCNFFGGNVQEGLLFSSSQGAGTIGTNVANQNNFVSNNVGLTYNGTEAINATNNWWGSPTGPTIASNPGGTGDKITNPSGSVTYSPFLSSPAGCAPAAPVDLGIAKTSSGNFKQGDTGKTYTITVTNLSAFPSSGIVTVSDSLPAGLIARALSGPNWTCDPIPGGGTAGPATLNCTRSDVLNAGQSYQPITLTVDVSCSAPSSVTNTATVSGGGDTVPGNNSSSATDPVGPDPTAPVITCPGGVSKYVDSGQFTATVNPGTPVATDNCGSPSITGVRNDGKALNAPYPVGVTVITWTARDAANNSSSCSQTVTVMIPSGQKKIPGSYP